MVEVGGGCRGWSSLHQPPQPPPSSTDLVYVDLLRHPVHDVRLAVLGVGPEAQEEVAPGREGRCELGVPADIEGRDAPQPLAGRQRALFTPCFPGDEVLQRLARRQSRDHDLVRLRPVFSTRTTCLPAVSGWDSWKS